MLSNVKSSLPSGFLDINCGNDYDCPDSRVCFASNLPWTSSFTQQTSYDSFCACDTYYLSSISSASSGCNKPGKSQVLISIVVTSLFLCVLGTILTLFNIIRLYKEQQLRFNISGISLLLSLAAFFCMIIWQSEQLATLINPGIVTNPNPTSGIAQKETPYGILRAASTILFLFFFDMLTLSISMFWLYLYERTVKFGSDRRVGRRSTLNVNASSLLKRYTKITVFCATIHLVANLALIFFRKYNIVLLLLLCTSLAIITTWILGASRIQSVFSASQKSVGASIARRLSASLPKFTATTSNTNTTTGIGIGANVFGNGNQSTPNTCVNLGTPSCNTSVGERKILKTTTFSDDLPLTSSSPADDDNDNNSNNIYDSLRTKNANNECDPVKRVSSLMSASVNTKFSGDVTYHTGGGRHHEGRKTHHSSLTTQTLTSDVDDQQAFRTGALGSEQIPRTLSLRTVLQEEQDYSIQRRMKFTIIFMSIIGAILMVLIAIDIYFYSFPYGYFAPYQYFSPLPVVDRAIALLLTIASFGALCYVHFAMIQPGVERRRRARLPRREDFIQETTESNAIAPPQTVLTHRVSNPRNLHDDDNSVPKDPKGHLSLAQV